VPGHPLYRPVSRFPAVARDLAIVVARAVPEAEVHGAILAAGGELVRAARLFDVYAGEGIPQGKRSLAYALTYQSPERTLTDAEVDTVQARIVAALRERFDAALRG
jgi:phenylalanyl-tRNA synthetase beta chain